MKLCKKTLSVILTMLILVSCVNVCFAPITAHASATNPTDAELKAAFATISNTTDFTNGDGTLLKAADALYYWAYNKAKTTTNTVNDSYSSPALTKTDYNSTVDLNSKAKSIIASTYHTLINQLIGTSGVYDDSNFKATEKSASYNNPTFEPGKAFDSSNVTYKIATTPSSSKTVTANIDKILFTYASLADVEENIITSVKYTYEHKLTKDYVKNNVDTKRFGVLTKRVWQWKSYSWHTLKASQQEQFFLLTRRPTKISTPSMITLSKQAMLIKLLSSLAK